MRFILALYSLLLALPTLADFTTCVDGLRSDAVKRGIPQATVTEVFSRIEELPRVVTQDRNQPEFTQTFTQYYSKRVTDYRVSEGRRLLKEYAPLLAKLSQETGVTPQYLLALWGLETNFGNFFGNLYIPSALATLACDSRRSDFFRRELMATLTIIGRGDIAPEAMIGSWAGAIGHMQFMPTTYIDHARDGDGDQRRDLIGSVADALTSGAYYVQRLGWQPGFRWGREVQLPKDFDYANSGSDRWQPLGEWRALGVQTTNGAPIPALDLQAALLLPTGHQGPAFLVYKNFRVIMGWNRSEHYALVVGRLADRIAGAGSLHNPLPDAEDIRVATKDVLALQEQLNRLGFATGKPDGIIGPNTRKAIRTFQSQHGLIADGYPNDALLEALRNAAAQNSTPKQAGERS